jgi:hypothetical protein
LLNQVRGELTLHEQVVVPPLFVEATELARRAGKPLPPRVIAFVAELNANPGAVTDEDLNRLQIRGTDTYSHIRLPELLPLVEPAIAAQAQAAFPDAPASQAVVLRWHLRSLNLDLALRKAALSASPSAKLRFPRRLRRERPIGTPQCSLYRQCSRQVTIEHLQIHTQSLMGVHELPRGVGEATACEAGVGHTPTLPLLWQMS